MGIAEVQVLHAHLLLCCAMLCCAALLYGPMDAVAATCHRSLYQVTHSAKVVANVLTPQQATLNCVWVCWFQQVGTAGSISHLILNTRGHEITIGRSIDTLERTACCQPKHNQ